MSVFTYRGRTAGGVITGELEADDRMSVVAQLRARGVVATAAIRNLIREEKVHQIYSALQAGSKYGMQTMNQALADLVRRRLITREHALNRSTIPDELVQLLHHEGPPSTPSTAGSARTSR